MGWFSPVKGSYPSLAQVDKTLPVDDSITELERGMIVTLGKDADGKPVWKLPTAGTEKVLYVALQGLSDPTAGFAGTAFDPKGGAPAITGIDLAQDGEYETSVFDPAGSYEIGGALYVNNKGVLTTSGTTIVGYVTQTPASRWINNAIAVPDQKKYGPTDPRLAIRTGSREKVIRFKTAL